MTNIQIEKAHPQQVGIREVKKKRWKRIFTSHFSLHSQWESRKVKMPEVAASAPLTLDLIRPSRFGLRKTRTLWILPNSTPSDAARKKKTDKCFSHQGCAKYSKNDRISNMSLALWDLWILSNSTPSDDTRKKTKTKIPFSHIGCA